MILSVDHLLQNINSTRKHGKLIQWYGPVSSKNPLLRYCGTPNDASIFSDKYYARCEVNNDTLMITFISLFDQETFLQVGVARNSSEWQYFQQLLYDLVVIGETSLEDFLRSNIWAM